MISDYLIRTKYSPIFHDSATLNYNLITFFFNQYIPTLYSNGTFFDFRYVTPTIVVIPLLAAKTSVCWNPLLYVAMNPQVSLCHIFVKKSTFK